MEGRVAGPSWASSRLLGNSRRTFPSHSFACLLTYLALPPCTHAAALHAAPAAPPRCQVEYAPFQKVPRQRVKRDPKEGSIERGAAATTNGWHRMAGCLWLNG